MKPPKRQNQIGRLEIIFSAPALFLTIGSIVGPWTFNPLIALVLFAIVYGVLRDLRALKGLRKPVTTQHSPRKSHAEQTDRALAELQKLLTICPADVLARCDLALLLEQMDLHDEALCNWKAVLDFDPKISRHAKA